MSEPGEYSATDWLLARPLLHGFKRARNVLIDRAFRAFRPKRLERFLADHADLRSRSVAIAIAFNEPWVIDLLTATAGNLVGSSLIVLDNSRSRLARAEIAAICRARGVAYLALPPNPERHRSRSHGIAMNWAYYNVIRPLAPDVFAFIDHDLFPLRPVDLAGFVRRQPVYGIVRRSGKRWYLWAGYSVFSFAALRDRPLDFNTDIPRGLDTGGRNWIALYRHLDAAGFRFARAVPAQKPDASGELRPMKVDDFVHVGGAAGGRRDIREAERAFFRRLIETQQASR